jgi:hypothetical protein
LNNIITRPRRQAAIDAQARLDDQPASSPPRKKSRNTSRTSTTMDEVMWIVGQFGSDSALELTRDMVGMFSAAEKDVRPTQGTISTPAIEKLPGLLSIFVDVGRSLVDGPVANWSETILRRFHSSYFDQIYTLAMRQGGSASFFHLSEIVLREHQIVPVQKSYKGYGVASAVKDRLVDLIFLDGRDDSDEARERAKNRIREKQQEGKRWSRLICPVGHEVLFLLPPTVTENR